MKREENRRRRQAGAAWAGEASVKEEPCFCLMSQPAGGKVGQGQKECTHFPDGKSEAQLAGDGLPRSTATKHR